MWLQFSKKVADGSERKFAVTESKILPQYQISLFAHFVLAGILLGSAFPKPCLCGFCRLSLPLSCGKRKEVITMPKRYNTPHRSRVIKTRLTEEEYWIFVIVICTFAVPICLEYNGVVLKGRDCFHLTRPEF